MNEDADDKKEEILKLMGSPEWRRKIASSINGIIRKKMLLNGARHFMSWGPNGKHLVAQKMAEAELRYGKLTKEEIAYVESGPRSLEASIEEKRLEDEAEKKRKSDSN